MNRKYRGTPLMSFLFKMRNNTSHLKMTSCFSTCTGGSGRKWSLSSHLPLLKLLMIFNLKQHHAWRQRSNSYVLFLWSLRAVFHPPGGSSVLCGLAVCAERWGGLMFQQSRLRKLPDAERKWHLRSRKYGELRAAQLAHQTAGEGRNSNNVSEKQS